MSFEDEPPDQLSLGGFGRFRPEPGHPKIPRGLTEFQGNPEAAFRPKASVGLVLCGTSRRGRIHWFEIHSINLGPFPSACMTIALIERVGMDLRSLRDAQPSPAVWPAELFELLGRLRLLRSLRLTASGSAAPQESRGRRPLQIFKLPLNPFVHRRMPERLPAPASIPSCGVAFSRNLRVPTEPLPCPGVRIYFRYHTCSGRFSCQERS